MPLMAAKMKHVSIQTQLELGVSTAVHIFLKFQVATCPLVLKFKVSYARNVCSSCTSVESKNMYEFLRTSIFKELRRYNY